MAQINKPSDYFNTVTYTGNGGTQSVTGVGFQPDWCWIKSRSNPGVYSHETYDVIRGVRNNLSPNSTDAEFTIPTTGFESFDSDGFTVQLSDNYARGLNENNQLIVSWNWLAGGTASSNTDGSITSQVSANTTSGFSIGTYSGNSTSDATVGHGLSSTPEMIIVKNRDGLDNWQVYWNTGTERNGFLSLTNAFNTPAATAQWGTNVPTSSVFYLGNDSATNTANDYVFYAFHSVKGYSKFGEYTGNGSTNGTFVYTGFKPAFVLSKCSSAAGEDWNINDNERPGYNVIQNALLPNSSSAEVTASYQAIDILSNGFKWRGDNARVNGSGNTYIYMAFAENPLVGTNNIPATAR